MAKLTEEQVIMLRKDWEEGKHIHISYDGETKGYSNRYWCIKENGVWFSSKFLIEGGDLLVEKVFSSGDTAILEMIYLFKGKL